MSETYSQEAIERAAKVIYRVACEMAYEKPEWDDMDEETRRVWLNDARDVIAALKGEG